MLRSHAFVCRARSKPKLFWVADEVIQMSALRNNSKQLQVKIFYYRHSGLQCGAPLHKKRKKDQRYGKKLK